MDEEKIEAIGKALRTEGHRLKAIELIAKIEPLPRSLATAWINDLVYAFSTETGAYNEFQILEQLKRFVAEYPGEAAEAVPPVVEEVNDELRDTDETDHSNSTKVEWGTEILWNVVENTTPSETRFNIRPEDVDAFLNRGDSEHRALGYRLLGRSAIPEAVRGMTGDLSYEVDSVVEARDAAAEDAHTVVLDSLDGNGYLTTFEAVVSFSELYSAGLIEPDSRTLKRVRHLIAGKLRSEIEDRERFLSTVERIANRDDDFAENIGIETFRLLDGDPDERSIAWCVLSKIAECTPTVVLDRAEKLAREIDSDGANSTLEGLEIVSILGKHTSAIPADLAKSTVRALEREERDVVLTAIDAVSAIGFHPPPDQLVRLTERNNRVGTAASKATNELSKREQRRSASRVHKLRKEELEVSLFREDTGEIHLKRRTDDGVWTDLDLSTTRRGIVEDTVEAVDRSENVPIVFPYYEPKDIVLLAVALVLSGHEEDRQIGVYSPGSRTHWGMKGEIRDELERFALSGVTGEVVNAEPIPDIVPHAYVWDGEVKNDSKGEGPGRFILCKKLHDLEYVDDLDIVLLNLTSRTKENVREKLHDVEEEHPEATFVNAYSYYVKNERDGRPRYGPPLGLSSTSTVPRLETVDRTLREDDFDWNPHLPKSASAEAVSSDQTKGISSRGNWSLGDDDIRSLADGSSIKIDHVDAEDVSSLLDQVFQESASLRGVDDGGAGGMIFSRQLFFERLPVPGKDFDEWVRDRYYEGERFVPPLIEERIEDVKQRAGSVENLQAVRPLNRSERLFQQIARRLRDQNPLFDKLKEYVSDSRESDRQLAIFSESPKHAEILRYSLLKRDVVTQEELEEGTISVVSPDEARGIGVYDVLLVFGALHKENAGFYLHPRVRETVVLTYDRTWATMIERHAREFIDTLNSVVGSPDYSPYPYPELSGDTEPESVAESDDVESTGENVVADGDRQQYESSSMDSTDLKSSGSKSKADILADAMESVSTREYREESGRYEREVRHYIVETEADERIKLTNHDRVLRKRTNSGKVEYHWVNPEALTSEDTVATIPDEIEEELWREQLRELYENEVGADQAVDRLSEWYEALQEIWRRVEDELSSDSGTSDSKIHGTIFDLVTQSNEDFGRTRATVRSWFNSILDADGPRDLVENPSLTIGPRSYADIEAIGRAFGHDKLVSDAKEIEAAMEGLRTINRQQGHELHDTIREQMNSSRSTRVSDAANHHVVRTIEETSDEADSE